MHKKIIHWMFPFVIENKQYNMNVLRKTSLIFSTVHLQSLPLKREELTRIL